MIDNLLEFLASELGLKDATELATLKAEDGKLKEGFQDILKPKIAALKTKYFNEGKSEGKTEGKGWAERENKQKWEKEFAQALGVDVAPLPDMISSYKEKNKTAAKVEKLTDNEFLNDERHLNVVKKLKEDLEAATTELSTLKSDKEVSGKVGDLTGILKQSLMDKYLLTDKAFEDRLRSYIKTQQLKSENGVYTPVDDNGNPIRSSENSDIISLVDHFEKTQISDYFLPKEHKSDTPGGKGDKQDDKKPDITIPSYASESEWMKAISTETDADRKMALVDASRTWEASQ